MFMIFILMDLIVVLVCRAAYGKKHEYREGMLFECIYPGMHLKQRISELTDKYRRRWILFQMLNLPGRSRGMLYLLSQFCSVYDDLADLADTICCGNDVFGLSSSQSLIYRIKMKNGWVRESGPPDCQNRYRRFCPVTEDDVLLKWHFAVGSYHTAVSAGSVPEGPGRRYGGCGDSCRRSHGSFPISGNSCACWQAS